METTSVVRRTLKQGEQGPEYKLRTYAEMSLEARDQVGRITDLISQMYDRLTLEDGFVHKEAVNKIWIDHKDLMGFSQRNIYRNLPKNNPKVPRRVRRVMPKWHNDSIAGNQPNDGQGTERPFAGHLPNSTVVIKVEPNLLEISYEEDPEVRKYKMFANKYLTALANALTEIYRVGGKLPYLDLPLTEKGPVLTVSFTSYPARNNSIRTALPRKV